MSASQGELQRVSSDIGRHLERVDPALGAWSRLIFGGRATVSSKLGEVLWRLTFLPDPPADSPSFAWHVALGLERGWVGVDSLEVLMEGSEEALAGLDSAFVRALLAEAGAELVAQLAAVTGVSLRVIDTAVHRRRRRDAAAQLMQVENTSNGTAAKVVLEQETAHFFSRVGEFLQALVPPRSAHEELAGFLLVHIALEIPRISHAELLEVGPGDVLLLRAMGATGALRAICLDQHGKRLPISAAVVGKTVRLTYCGVSVMTDEGALPTDAEGNENVLDAVVTPVTAVIGEVEMSLRELGRIDAGYVLELPNDIEDATVQLYIGRTRVGAGKLVAIGERLGVRLVQWRAGAADGLEST
jgi:flagellar motor switch/type III secretory pathway protein FliN